MISSRCLVLLGLMPHSHSGPAVVVSVSGPEVVVSESVPDVVVSVSGPGVVVPDVVSSHLGLSALWLCV